MRGLRSKIYLLIMHGSGYTPPEVLEQVQTKVKIGEKLNFTDYPEQAAYGFNELRSGFEKVKNRFLAYAIENGLMKPEVADKLRVLAPTEKLPKTYPAPPDQQLLRTQILKGEENKSDETGRTNAQIVREIINRVKSNTETKSPKDVGSSVMLENSGLEPALVDYINRTEELEKIVKQSLENQREMVIDSPDLGRVGCRSVEILAKKKENIPVEDQEPLVIYIGGWGTDLESIIPMLLELPLNGRDVIGLSMPDSLAGILSDKFLEKAKASPSLEAHADFYKELVREIRKNNPGRKIELMGQSTGSLVVADMLNDNSFSDEVDRATLIASAGAVDMPKIVQQVHYIFEGVGMLARKRSLMYSYVSGMSDRSGLETDEEEIKKQDELRSKVWDEVKARTPVTQKSYDTMRVKEGGKILVVTGGKDQTTKDYERFNEATVKNSDQLEILHNPEGKHQDTNTLADVLVPKIEEKWKEIENRMKA